jgi:hypothetical protein
MPSECGSIPPNPKAINLAFPIAIMRDDANNIRAHAEKMWDADEKAKALDRADQCDLAAKILELYVQQTKSG